jgi:hypothetical protein
MNSDQGTASLFGLQWAFNVAVFVLVWRLQGFNAGLNAVTLEVIATSVLVGHIVFGIVAARGGAILTHESEAGDLDAPAEARPEAHR